MYNPQVMQWHWRSTCIAFGCWTTNTTHLLPLPGQLRVGGVEGSQRRHERQLWRERGRRWVLQLEMRLLLSECQNSLEETSQPLNSP